MLLIDIIVELDCLMVIIQINKKLMLKYITFTRKKINDNYYQDPNTNSIVENATGWITKFTETPYEVDWKFIWYVEFPTDTPDEQIEYFRSLDPDFNFTFITEEEANTELAKLWEVSVKEFVFTDKRIFDLI